MLSRKGLCTASCSCSGKWQCICLLIVVVAFWYFQKNMQFMCTSFVQLTIKSALLSNNEQHCIVISPAGEVCL